MRSHAKAATVGTNDHQADRLGRALRGSGIASHLVASRASDGSGAPAAAGRALLLALVSALLVLALGAAPALAAAPAIPTTTVSGVTVKSAVLEADVNPEGEATTYHFEYGPADCASSSCASVPVPDGNVGSGSSAVRVANEVSGLAADTTYHFRVVATNGSGTIAGPDRTFTTYPASEANTSCPNQAFRVGLSATLPDCRAYEMVSPVEKNNGDIRLGGGGSLGHSAVMGGKVTYGSLVAFGDAESAPMVSQYVSDRGPSGWSPHDVSPPMGTNLPFLQLWPFYKGFAEDLSMGVLFHVSQPITPDGLDGWADLYTRDFVTDAFRPLITNATPPTHYPPPSQDFWPEYLTMTPDGSHILFRVKEGLLPGDPYTLDAFGNPKDNLYEWVDGQLRLVSVLPNGEPSAMDNTAGTENSINRFGGLQSVEHAISDDGSRIFWSTQVDAFNHGKLYVRVDGQTTIPVSESVSNEQARFWTASADGSDVLFTLGSDFGLDDSSDPGLPLYKFNVDTETPALIANQVMGVVGGSDDLSYFYFVSKDVLDAGATSGEANLYLYHGGTPTFIATVAPSEGVPSGRSLVSYALEGIGRTAQATPDGRHLVFASRRSLTGYDNFSPSVGKQVDELYRYDFGAEELKCVSCNPSGARPLAAELGFAGIAVAAKFPVFVNSFSYQPRVITDDGEQIFFSSYDALVPRDTNGMLDVYQWEDQGVGDCNRPAGCINLLSTGKSPQVSEYLDASADGTDVFLATKSSILPQDPGLVDIYDARAAGGFPPPPAPPAPCEGDACQNPGPPPNDATPASASFRGAGDPQPRKARRRCRARSRRHSGARQSKRKRAARCRRGNRRVHR